MPEALETATPRATPEPPASRPRRARYITIGLAAWLLAATAVFLYYYVSLARTVDARLASGPFSDTIDMFASPRTFGVGDSLTLQEAVARLRRAGFTTAQTNPVGWYHLRADALEIFPGRNSLDNAAPAVLSFAEGRISRIIALSDNTERTEYSFEPRLITNLSQRRERRRLVKFTDLPPTLVNAVISAEDKHFFTHRGFDLPRIVKAAYVDVKEGRKQQGASTLTMQLARSLWLDSDKVWSRKAAELLIALRLEHRLTKQQIFEYYANQVYLGRRGTFSINGFGAGARAFFGKDLADLSLPEAALLAGIVQRPNYCDPFRHPERAQQRRDIVLGLMLQNGFIDRARFESSVATPVRTSPDQTETIGTQYFLDLVNDELQDRLDDHEKQMRYVFTTLDPDLQRAAEDAVRSGLAQVDARLAKRKDREPAPPQVALVALDPHTGEIKALVGGRDYGASQLNHAQAQRQPGSVFKPFVFAAAFDTAIRGGADILTPASLVVDEPGTFYFGKQVYQPENFGGNYMGTVSLRTALAHSLNNATVRVAEQVGYARVAALARSVGLETAQATPAVALGAYEATPLDIARAYTAFANGGAIVEPTTIALVRARNGSVLYQHRPAAREVLDPRVAYLTTAMMEEVLRSGTGAGARASGFTLPAAGKTGTARDGWFAGFTSELLCVVWVGFDDGHDLNLEGAKSALPIWAGFMKSAAALRHYRDARVFQPPAGVTSVDVCSDSGELASPYCPRTHFEVFIKGTEPVTECPLHAPYVAGQSGGTTQTPITETGRSQGSADRSR